MLEDDKVFPYRWLKPDLVAPAPLLCCDPCLTVDGSGVLSDPGRIDEQFRSAWLPFFCRAGRGAADPSVFDHEVGGWLPRVGEFDLPPLLGSDLYYVVQHKRVSAGGLDGWGWRDLKAFPEAWFDRLAVVLSRVELDGVWPDGLLDAFVHCRLRSIGWERCGHRLTSKSLETSDAGFLDDLLSLFGYPVGSGQSLVDGSLRMRYCSAKFSCRKPTWGLPHSGGVAALVGTASFRPTVAGFRGSGNILGVRTFAKIERKRIRLTKKTSVRKRFGVDLWEQPIPKRWESRCFSGGRFLMGRV